MKFNKYMKKKLNENFIGVKEVESMTSGVEKDKQILRMSIIAEMDAINLYEKFAVLTSNKDLKKVLLDIANEEKVHVGEFEEMLKSIDSDYKEEKKDGEEEVKDLLGKDNET